MKKFIVLTALVVLLPLLLAAEAAKENNAASPPPGKILFVGKNKVATANGEFKQWEFTKVEIDRDHPEKSVVELKIDIASLGTGIERRDKHLRSEDFFDIAKFPSATVRIHDAAPKPGAEAGHQMYSAKMDLDIHGVKKTVDFEFNSTSAAPFEVNGSLAIDRTDFGVGAPARAVNPMAVEHEVRLTFNARFPKNSETWPDGTPVNNIRGTHTMLRVSESRILLALAIASIYGGAAAQPGAAHFWQPAADNVYLQETGRRIETESPALSVAVHEGKVYAGFADGLRLLKGDAFEPISEVRGPVTRLVNLEGSLFVLTPAGPHRAGAGGWQKLSDSRISDVCLHLGKIYGAADRKLLRLEGESFKPFTEAEAPEPILRVLSYAETLYVATDRRLLFFDGQGFNDIDVADFGFLPSQNIRDALAIGGRIYLAADRGLGVLHGSTYSAVRGADGLCYEDTTALAPGFDRDLWIGTSQGAIRSTGGEFHFFGAGRWLPGDRVNQIAAKDRTVYIATDKGIGIIEYEPYTMLKKAAYYERHLEEWGQKRLGFVHRLVWNGALKEFVREISDNDGGWTSEHLSAMSYKFGATGDPAARAEADEAFNALKWTEEITPIDGFPARSVWVKGEKGDKAQHGSGGLPAEWHDVEGGVFEWKADTSSDEVDAHFYTVALYHDLAAEGRNKERAAIHLGRIAAHIVDNGWILRDVDGKATTWARWNPEYLQTPEGYTAGGLNGLEILSFMRTAHTFTGDAKFEKAHRDLLGMGYADRIVRLKLTGPPDDVVPWDDHLAAYAYANALRYERDPGLRSIYARSIARSFEMWRVEHRPWQNFVYGSTTGSDCEVEASVRHLREWPLDLIEYGFHNSHRSDLATPKGYVVYGGSRGIRPFSPRERGGMRWDNTTLEADGGSDGHAVTDPSGWLHAYWMGRYYGMIEPPKTQIPEFTTVERRGFKFSAAPYSGPPRPALEP